MIFNKLILSDKHSLRPIFPVFDKIVLKLDLFENILDRLDDQSDLQAIREAHEEPLYGQKDAEDYIFMNSVKRERFDRGWTQQGLAEHLGVKQSTIAKWERKDAVYRKKTS